MKLELKRRLAALIGYPITYVFGYFDKTESEKKETEEVWVSHHGDVYSREGFLDLVSGLQKLADKLKDTNAERAEEDKK